MIKVEPDSLSVAIEDNEYFSAARSKGEIKVKLTTDENGNRILSVNGRVLNSYEWKLEMSTFKIILMDWT